ncbi:PEBP-like protein [Pluteus cervinus]|uniref:PEBP-like protein n=1 Tax=Pluteus cervinus TaxID=181527 RepID=A0ACD3AUY2_9AGAR|nr:PEBP-like protein [Pluteus cervinus]
MFLRFTFLLSLASFISAQDSSLNEVVRAFTTANIPTNLNIRFNPTSLLQVDFPQSASRPVAIHAGIQLPRNQTAGPPLFSADQITSRGPFVIAAVDPDAPTPQAPTASQIRHFLGGNFFIKDDGVLANNTPAVSNYLQPTPPAGSPAHRYIFLLYNQPSTFNQQTIITPSSPIQSFNISQFAISVGLGNPIAGTFMLVAPPS